eukprot:2862012-Rhodomonas_salina.1
MKGQLVTRLVLTKSACRPFTSLLALASCLAWASDEQDRASACHRQYQARQRDRLQRHGRRSMERGR